MTSPRRIDNFRVIRSPRGLDASELAVQLLRVRLEACEIRFGVGSVLDAMLGVEETRDVEVGADVLNDCVGRVAPAADRDIAIGQCESLD